MSKRKQLGISVGLLVVSAAAVVRTLALVASHIPRKPTDAEAAAPMRKARVRNSPDSTKLSAVSPSSLRISVEVRKTTTASGTTITAMVRNWRLM